MLLLDLGDLALLLGQVFVPFVISSLPLLLILTHIVASLLLSVIDLGASRTIHFAWRQFGLVTFDSTDDFFEDLGCLLAMGAFLEREFGDF